MTIQTQEILNELKQICEQYKAEVPGRHRAWPESVKNRVQLLRQAGVSYPKIAKVSAISLPTLYKWAQDERAKKAPIPPEFHQLPVVLSHTEAVTKPAKEKSFKKATTITVIAPSGLKVMGLKVADACKVIRELER